jgi:hypothetical protein
VVCLDRSAIRGDKIGCWQNHRGRMIVPSATWLARRFEQSFQACHVKFQCRNRRRQRADFFFEQLMLLQKRVQQLPLQPMLHERGTIQLKQRDVKMSRLSERLDKSCLLVQPHVFADPVKPRVKNSMPKVLIFNGWKKVAFVLIALEAGVDKIVVAVVAAIGSRTVVVDGELAAGIRLRNPTVAAPAFEAFPHRVMLAMGHELILDPQALPRVLGKRCFDAGQFGFQLTALDVELIALSIQLAERFARLAQRFQVGHENLFAVQRLQAGFVSGTFRFVEGLAAT